MLAVAIGCAVSASRGIFAMARDRRIPGALATVSRRHDSPFGATVFLVGAAVAMDVGTLPFDPRVEVRPDDAP